MSNSHPLRSNAWVTRTMSRDKHEQLHETTERLGKERLSKLFLRLSTPSMVSMMAMSLYVLADTFWLGRVSYQAIAPLTITLSFYGVIFAIALGVSEIWREEY